MKLVRCSIAVALLFSALAGVAQTAAPAAAASQMHAKARRLLEVSGAGNLGMQMIDQMLGSFKENLPAVPAEFWNSFRSRLNAGEMLDLIAPVYEKHLSEADMDALIAFYSSPAGKRFVEKQPLIAADSMKLGQEWGERIAGEVIAELKKKGYGQ